MTNRMLVALGVALAVLVGAALLPMAWSDDGSSGGGDASAEQDPLGLDGFTADEVERIIIERPGAKRIVVTRTDAAWRVATRPADAKKVDAFFAALGDAAAERAELVARADAAHAGLGVDAVSGAKVTLERGGDEQVTFIVGRAADVPGAWYGRVDGSPRTWQLQGDVSSALPTDAASWQPAPPAKNAAPADAAA